MHQLPLDVKELLITCVIREFQLILTVMLIWCGKYLIAMLLSSIKAKLLGKIKSKAFIQKDWIFDPTSGPLLRNENMSK